MPPHNKSLLNQKQTISYLVHHFQGLKNLANRIHPDKQFSNEYSLNPEIIKGHILQTVELMQKKICFFIQDKSQVQFQDYITQFYEQQIQKIRQQYNKVVSKCKRMDEKFRESKIQDSLKDFSGNHNYSSNLDSNLSVLEQRQVTIKLKKQLSHCQTLIQQNQHFIQQQNNLIKQLTQQIHSIQQRQTNSRHRYEQSVLKYDNKTKQISDKFRQVTKQFTQNRKVYQKQLKQLQLNNVKIMDDKSSLQEQVLLKSQQISLLAKRIYDLQLCLSKYERQLESKKVQNYENNQALVLLDKEVKVWKGKFLDGQNNKQSKIDSVLQDKRTVQQKNRDLAREVQQLKRKISEHYKVNQIASQKRQKNLKQLVAFKQQQNKALQSQVHQLQTKLRNQSNEIKQLQQKYQLKQKQSTQFSQQIKQLQQQIKQQQNLYQTTIRKYNDQKSVMKRQIYQEVQQLLKINQQTVKRVKIQQKKISELTCELEDKQKSKHILEKTLLKLEMLNQQLIKRNQAFMKEITEYKQIKQDLQAQLQQTKKQVQNSTKYRSLCKQQEKHVKCLENELQSIKTQKQQIAAQLKQYEEKNALKQNQTTNKQSLTTQISLLKQQHHKKDFLIKQLQSKISLLQQELRQLHQITQIQRQKMKNKIRQLEQLLRERYDFSNRPSNSG